MEFPAGMILHTYKVSDWTRPTHGTSLTVGLAAGFTAVLAKCDIFVSKTTLGNAPDLEKMAKEDFVSAMTGATQSWRVCESTNNLWVLIKRQWCFT